NSGFLVFLGVAAFVVFIFATGTGGEITDAFNAVSGAAADTAPTATPEAGDQIPDIGGDTVDDAADTIPTFGLAFTQASAKAGLATLTTDDTPDSGYDRAEYGPKWTDVDRNGCNTRDDILARDLTDTKRDGCTVLSGSFVDPFTGSPFDYVRGSDPQPVAVVRVVGLESAWGAGASSWDVPRRAVFANDPLNLVTVSSAEADVRAGRGPDGWLPPNAGFVCGWAARQVAVMVKYGLSVTSSERAALDGALNTCTS
ncbi:HNH endonuclease family protein, partial [Agromyces humi]|uniref:HNH endonuclease family protein n=1 Tax=Agromyces humi TaxID=1766800 RepID=UPI001359CC46